MSGIVDRVAAEAVQVRPLRALVTVFAVPFYVVGAIVAVVWLLVVFAAGAVRVGFADVRARLDATSVVAAAPPDALDVDEDG